MGYSCFHCGINLHTKKKYCNNKCQTEFQYNEYIKKWQDGIVSGIRGLATMNFSAHIVRYIWSKFNGKCALCGWNKINPYTHKTPLEIDHIDGNSTNNSENNLILLCPNCHSMTQSYKNANIGHGRLWRREKYVKMV